MSVKIAVRLSITLPIIAARELERALGGDRISDGLRALMTSNGSAPQHALGVVACDWLATKPPRT
jgi:hypothetical protein